MITCKLCGTQLDKKHLRRDGSLLCPECGQIYWKAAVDAALNRKAQTSDSRRTEVKAEYMRQSRKRGDRIRARMA